MEKKKIIATGKLRMDGMLIPVNVYKIGQSYGKIRYTVSPINGIGTVKKEDVQLDKEYAHLLDILK